MWITRARGETSEHQLDAGIAERCELRKETFHCNAGCPMKRRLPDGRRLPYTDVQATVEQYRTAYPAVLDLFDQTNPGPHDEIMAIDLLALNALNAFGGPIRPMTSMWQQRQEIVQNIPEITTAPLENLTEQQIECALPTIDKVIKQIDSVRGFGDTATSKLFHRLRPNVGAIWDSRVEGWYPPTGSRGGPGSWIPWLRTVYSQVREPESRECLQAVQRSLDVPLSLLRIWDIVLWQLNPTPGS